MSRNFAHTAALFSDPGRASILTALLGGIALPAGQLAMIANVAPQTASSHLSRLVDGRLLAVEQQGRHRYYRLADAEVANAIEALLAITPGGAALNASREAQPVGSLGYARTCYSHLAGMVAVRIADALQQRGIMLARYPKGYSITRLGRSWFAALGIGITEAQERSPRLARPCLDWTERRHHVAGQLGAMMFTRFRELKWIAPVRGSRAVRVTLEGERKLERLLGLALPGH